jgi:sugar lactone lactonase YvrE
MRQLDELNNRMPAMHTSHHRALRSAPSYAAASGIATIISLAVGGSIAHAGGGIPANPDYRIVRPSNTGIPGYVDMDMVEFGPDGRLWVAARDFFWQQGGVARLDFATAQWKTWSSEETPLEQESNAIDFAADGSAWIAGQNFIARLHSDGETFTSYTPASTGVLVSGMYENITVAPNGHIWASNPGSVDLGGGLFEFDGTVGGWIKHEEPWMTTWTGLGFAPALNVLARSNGDVWATFLSSPPRVGRYRAGQWTVYESSQMPRVIDYAEDADGTLYGVSAFGTFRLNDASGQWQQIGSVGASEIALDPGSDALYIQNDLTSVMRYDGQAWSTFATFPGWVDGIGVGHNGDVWIAAEAWPTHSDLHQYNASGQMLRIYNRSNTGMLDYFPPGMHLDRDGVMWFTDMEYGATRMEPGQHGFIWRNFGVYNGQEEVHPFWTFPVGLPWWQTPGADFWTESVDQVYHDSRGDFWLRGPNIIARSAGRDLSQWATWEPGQSGLPWLIDSMGEDALGNMWVGDAFAIYRLDGSAWSDHTIGIPGQFATVGLTQGLDGELYAVRVATVYRIRGSQITPVYSLPDGMGIITDLAVDADGTLWMGTPEHGVMRWDGKAAINYTPYNSALAELTVIDINIRPSDGVVAFSTSQQSTLPYDGGVALYEPATGQWTAYNYGESFLPHYALGEMQFDADGHLWISVLNYGAVHVFVGEAKPGVPGDVNGDGAVNVDDLIAVILAWGDCPAPPAPCPADVNDSGSVDADDLVMVILSWG